MDPIADGSGISDVLELVVSDVGYDDAHQWNLQHVSFQMWSDGASGFLAAIAGATVAGIPPSLVENGEFQTVSSALSQDEHKLLLQARSDVSETGDETGPPATVPEPASLILLGTGLTGFAAPR